MRQCRSALCCVPRSGLQKLRVSWTCTKSICKQFCHRSSWQAAAAILAGPWAWPGDVPASAAALGLPSSQQWGSRVVVCRSRQKIFLTLCNVW